MKKFLLILLALLLTAATLGGIGSAASYYRQGDTVSLAGDLVISLVLALLAWTAWRAVASFPGAAPRAPQETPKRPWER